MKNDTNSIKTAKTENQKYLKWRNRIIIAVIFIIVIAITAGLFINRKTLGDIQTYKNLGYLGIFLICLVSNATVILPVGGAMAVLFSHQVLDLNPAILGLVGSSGAALGELTGYMAGFGGQAIVKKGKFYNRMELWIKKRGFLTITIFSFMAVTFDLAGLAAGAFKYPIWKFFTACFIGRCILYIGFAYLGAYGLPMIYGKYILYGITGAIILVIVILIIWWQRKRNN